jgi:hypothetical protein
MATGPARLSLGACPCWTATIAGRPGAPVQIEDFIQVGIESGGEGAGGVFPGKCHKMSENVVVLRDFGGIE